MSGFEYKVVPAPTRGLKGKGIKGTQARFANALQSVMNDLGADGWEYQRTDTLPVEERQGLTGKTTSFQNMLVFRRLLVDDNQEAPVVTALLVDQTENAVDEPKVVETPEPQPEAPAAAAVDAEVTIVEPDAASEAPLELEARERVSETLKAAPFSFPWNRRRAVPGPKEDATATSEDAR